MPLFRITKQWSPCFARAGIGLPSNMYCNNNAALDVCDDYGTVGLNRHTKVCKEGTVIIRGKAR